MRTLNRSGLNEVFEIGFEVGVLDGHSKARGELMTPPFTFHDQKAKLDSCATRGYSYAIAQTVAGQTMRFTDTKSETLNLRVSPTFKQVLREAAHLEQRSMVNMLEVLLGDYCDRKCIVPAYQEATPVAHKRAKPNRRPHGDATA